MNKALSFSRIFFALLLLTGMAPVSSSGQDEGRVPRPRIAFLAGDPYEKAGLQTRKAFDCLKESGNFSAEYLVLKEAAGRIGKPGRYQAVWIHRADTAPLSGTETDRKFTQSLRSYVEGGGCLLLSHQAAHYLNVLGFEEQPLQDSTKTCADHGFGRRLGFHGYRDHPVFEGLNGGVYSLWPKADLTARITGFFGDRVPAQGRVVAVDWDYIFLRENTKLVVEYRPGKGKVLAVGGYMDFSIPNDHRGHLDRFTNNCLRYLTGTAGDAGCHYWDYSPGQVSECPSPPESDRLRVAVPPAGTWDLRPSGIAIKSCFASSNFWDVASERILAMGQENGGIEEVWAHPFMAFRDYQAGIRFSYRDTIYWLNDERPEITVDPACFSRQYKFQRAYLTETVVNDPTGPGGVIHYEYRGVYPAELVIRFTSNLRLMWPYSDRATGSVCHRWDGDMEAFTLADRTGRMNVMVGGNRTPAGRLSGRYSGFIRNPNDSLFTGVPTEKVQVSGLLRYRLAMNDDLDVVYAASDEGYDSTRAAYERTIADPGRVYRASAAHVEHLFHESLLVTTPDAGFNTGYRWALAATDRFFVHTPGMGKALVAGYSTTAHGWDGGHAVNGRPGYAWYFGRDAQWSGFALLDYGDFGKVKSQLEFFNRYQDLNGKIFHEASTSGMIHYDAADATPLYIVLAGKYFRHTNDTAFLRATWPHIRNAVDFCFSTDTDGDHLIENTNVGHGWVEGGELYGSHSTVYMAGSWGAALREAANMGRYMNDRDWSRFESESALQEELIDRGFWSDDLRYFAYGLNRDGSFRREQTILPAVPVLFRMTGRDKARAMLKNVAGNSFTTDWGVRILREESPWFKPTGYHYGSVWPLFTGWASLAEYASGLPQQGFAHLMNNLNVFRNWGLGFVEEVMNGAEYKPSGVCAHQCWSETMVLQPAIEGMLGLVIDAGKREIVLAPQLPPQWDSIRVERIRVAGQTAGYQYHRNGKGSHYRFTLSGGDPVTVRFMPAFPAGTKVLQVTVDGKPWRHTTFSADGQTSLVMDFELKEHAEVEVVTEGGIAVLPAVTDPHPGDPAAGFRILSTRLAGNRYEVEVEGPAGTTAVLSCWSAGDHPPEAGNATFSNRKGQVSDFEVVFGKDADKYVTRKIIFSGW